ncbi:hypothetical protein LCGC14_1672440 [marine sediment metagenome]|uniref:Uncharacterized protein n=1 Tax=marine sediment metagenome TaxID=412755 RepID=A0A0F9KQT2_9ZZZZ
MRDLTDHVREKDEAEGPPMTHKLTAKDIKHARVFIEHVHHCDETN